ncbi:MAG: uracil-DNA glycosylase [Nitrospirae bacterium]|nr:uracil-DNA glycosylase [Nitrospirota bacterium]
MPRIPPGLGRDGALGAEELPLGAGRGSCSGARRSTGYRQGLNGRGRPDGRKDAHHGCCRGAIRRPEPHEGPAHRVGEGPGRDEDIKGEPFVGRAGQLLTDIIEKGMKLKRSDVYIANVVKCRPPENRNPEDDEIAACEPFLLAQLSVIKPRLICALGKFAAQTLLKTKEPISTLRGKVFDYHGMKLVPTYHPAYLLRNPKEKAAVWKDVQLIMSMYGEDY